MELQRIKKLIAEHLNVDESSITLGTDLVKDLKADSLDIVELVMDLETEFNLEVADDELPEITTVEAILKYIEAHK